MTRLPIVLWRRRSPGDNTTNTGGGFDSSRRRPTSSPATPCIMAAGLFFVCHPAPCHSQGLALRGHPLLGLYGLFAAAFLRHFSINSTSAAMPCNRAPSAAIASLPGWSLSGQSKTFLPFRGSMSIVFSALLFEPPCQVVAAAFSPSPLAASAHGSPSTINTRSAALTAAKPYQLLAGIVKLAQPEGLEGVADHCDTFFCHHCPD